MGRIIFYYDNLWKAYTVTAATEHSNFPGINTQHRLFIKPYRSNYGAGSGWGRFVIGAANNKIYFDDTLGAPITATLTNDTYDADTLAAEIEDRMEAASGENFTVEYLESGADANKFKITNDDGNFELTCTNTTNAAWNTLGFDTAADKIGADNYTADYIRIHFEEFITLAIGSRIPAHGIFVRGHNLQSTATVRVQASNDAFATKPLNELFTTQDDTLVKIWPLAKKYNAWRIKVNDTDNPDLYIELGTIGLSIKFQPERMFSPEREPDKVDPSKIRESEGGQAYSIQEPHYGIWSYFFNGTDQKDEFDAMFDEVGTSKAFFYVEDSDSPLSTARYVTIVSKKWQHIAGDDWNLRLTLKEER